MEPFLNFQISVSFSFLKGKKWDRTLKRITDHADPQQAGKETKDVDYILYDNHLDTSTF